jgi:hypothetical protein
MLYVFLARVSKFLLRINLKLATFWNVRTGTIVLQRWSLTTAKWHAFESGAEFRIHALWVYFEGATRVSRVVGSHSQLPLLSSPLKLRRYNHLSGLAVKKDASWFVLTVQLSRPHNVYTRFHSWRLNFTHTIHDSRASYLQTDLLWILTFFQVCTSGIHVWQRMPSFGNLPDRCPAQRPLHGIHFPCIHCRLHIRSNDYFPRFNRTSLLVQVYATNASVLLLVHTRSDPWHMSIKFFYIDI